MPSSRILISSQTLGTAAATVTFSGIPTGYRDLVLRWSARSAQANATTRININLNGVSGTSYSFTKLQATGTSASSSQIGSFDKWWGEYVSADNATSNTFGSGELYLPNYLSTVNKPASFFSVAENNTAANGDWYVSALASLATITSAITSVALTLNTSDNFMAGSSFYLYGLLPS